jgi:spore coat polysaccharide biosynthesis predicted glycosyltransferase SpsG
LIHYYSDVVLNQNIGSEKLRFSAEDYTKFLLGTKYVILQDELLRRDEKNYRKKVYNILVTLGGTDQYNLTLKILKALNETNQESEIFVVIGPFNPFYEDLKKFVEKSDLKINLLKSPEKMAEIYLKADIAISAGGTSCYEIAYFGIPNLIVTITDNQLKNAEELDRQKVSINLGHKNKVFNKLITDKVNQLITNDSLMKLMGKNGMELVDGEGKKRIVEFVESFA